MTDFTIDQIRNHIVLRALRLQSTWDQMSVEEDKILQLQDRTYSDSDYAEFDRLDERRSNELNELLKWSRLYREKTSVQ